MQSTQLSLPESGELDHLLCDIDNLTRENPSWDRLNLNMNQESFLNPILVAFLTTWCLYQQRAGKVVELSGAPGPLAYLERINFQNILGLESKSRNRRPEAGRFTTLNLIADQESDVPKAVNQICDLVLHQFDNAGEFLPALEWAVNEVIDNIAVHSESPVPGVVHAQLYWRRGTLEIGIADHGIGIRKSLTNGAGGYQPSSDANAIETALERGVTRDSEIGQGNGLAGCREILTRNSGEMLICSGASRFLLSQHSEEFGSNSPLFGTAVRLSFDLKNPVDLTDCWIGHPAWTFIESEAERIEGKGVSIVEECAHTGGRAPARRLRRKIETLLPEMSGPLAIDFQGIDSASSSFLDELLGRLLKNLGKDSFKEKIRIHSLREELVGMSNVVVEQRLHGESAMLSNGESVGNRREKEGIGQSMGTDEGNPGSFDSQARLASYESGQDEIRGIAAEYRSDAGDLGARFFKPCLRHAVRYDRATGFFSSSSLLAWLEILPRLSANKDIKIRLLVSPSLRPSDAAALEQAVDASGRQELLARSIESWIDEFIGLEKTPNQKNLSDFFSWMIVHEIVELRFAFLKSSEDPSMYHEKIGVFGFDWGDKIAFIGSANESRFGHSENFESIDVFRSWEVGDKRRVEVKERWFEDAWGGRAAPLHVEPLTESALAKIKSIAPINPPRLDDEDLDDDQTPGTSGPKPPKLYDHQEKALEAWFNNSCRGFLEMCTGAGKTFTAIEGSSRLIQREIEENRFHSAVIVVVCPVNVLVEQWIQELESLQPGWRILSANESYRSYAPKMKIAFTPSEGDVSVIATTYATFKKRPMQSHLKRYLREGGPCTSILIADEAHHFGGENALEIAQEAAPLFSACIALSATPELEGENADRTQNLLDTFGGKIFEYGLFEAIPDVLCPYRYFPEPVFIEDDSGDIFSEIVEGEGRRVPRNLNQAYFVEPLERIVDDLRAQNRLEMTIVFSPPGFMRDIAEERILHVVKEVFTARHVRVASITQATNPKERAEALNFFSSGEAPVLLGIGCLDEGLDVPAARTAVMLYSFDRQKQFIQRRGRVLRKGGDQEKIASIYDLILLPSGETMTDSAYSNMVDKAIRRHREFASNAINREDAETVLDDALRRGR